MSDNMNEIPLGFKCIYSLLTSDECTTVLCLSHPQNGYIAVDKDLSNIYISANEFIASNAASCMSIGICYSEGGDIWSTSLLEFGLDSNLSNYVSISNCGQQYVIDIDISQVPIKRGICVQNSMCEIVQYGDAIYGHYHCNTGFDTTNGYHDSNITYGQICNSPQPSPPSLNSIVSELDVPIEDRIAPSKLPISRDYLYTPELDKPTQEDICNYCIAMMHDSHYLFSANKDQLPMKYVSVSSSNENTESIFTDEDWCNKFINKCHIYDGDLPYIDTKLLCQSDSSYKLPTCMIPYDSISYSNGSVTGDGDNSVTASNIASVLVSVCDYISKYLKGNTGGN